MGLSCQESLSDDLCLLVRLTAPSTRGDFSRTARPRQTAGNSGKRWECGHQQEAHPLLGWCSCWAVRRRLWEQSGAGLLTERQEGVGALWSHLWGLPSPTPVSLRSFPGSCSLLRCGDPRGGPGGLRLSSWPSWQLSGALVPAKAAKLLFFAPSCPSLTILIEEEIKLCLGVFLFF